MVGFFILRNCPSGGGVSKFILNCKDEIIEDDPAIASLLSVEGLIPNAVIVEYDCGLVRREDWHGIALKEKDRLDIFKVHTSDGLLHDDVDMNDLVLLTNGMVGSQISFICRNAAMMAISERINSSGNPPAKLVISARHFHNAIKSLEK